MPRQLRPWFNMKVAGKTAEIELFDELGGWMGVPIQQFKDKLDEASVADDILMLVNSPGGNVFDGIALYHMLTPFKNKLRVEVVGLCASAATLPALAGKSLTMGRGTYFMIHNPAGGVFGEAKELRKRADLLDQIKEEVVDTYVARSRLSREEVHAAMDSESWYTAQQAVDLGFADSVMDRGAVLNSADIAAWAELYGYHAPTFSDGTNPALPERPQWKIPPRNPAQRDGTNRKEDSMELSEVLAFLKNAKPEERAQIVSALGVENKASAEMLAENEALKSKNTMLEEALGKVGERCKTLEQKEHDRGKREAIELALNTGVILAKDREKWETRYDENPTFVAKLLKDMPKVVDYVVHGHGGGGGETPLPTVEDNEALARVNESRTRRGEPALTMEEFRKLQA